MIIVMNGVNDHWKGWQRDTLEGDGVLISHVGIEALNFYWQFHAEKKLINWRQLATLPFVLIPNTTRLFTTYGAEWFALRRANSDLDQWKEQYREIKQKVAQQAAISVPAGRAFYIQQMHNLIVLAQAHDIAVVVAQQPMIFSTTKPLVAQENDEFLHPQFTHFALSEAELDGLTKAPAARLNQLSHWNFEEFVRSYATQQEALRKLSTEHNVGYVDVLRAVNAAGRLPVFSSQVHFTYRGADIIAKAFAPVVVRMMHKNTIQ